MSETDQLDDSPPVPGRHSPSRQQRRPAVPTPHLPIDYYEFLTSAEIVAHFSRLSPAAIELIRDHERANRQRRTVLTAAERALLRKDKSSPSLVDNSDTSLPIEEC